MDNNLISKLIKQNEHIGDNSDIIGSIAKIAITNLENAVRNDDTSYLYDVMNMLKVILEKSLSDEDDSVQLGCNLENLLHDYTDGVEINLRLDGINEVIKNE